MLADDIAALLDAVGVRKAKAVIGVSIGGATVLKFAIRYPERTEGMVCGSIFARSPEGGQRVWEERVAIAEGETVVDEAGERVVGGPLAELSVRRWFVKGSFDGGVMEERIEGIGRLVEGNSLGGFRALVHALYDFDMREEMVGCKVKGIFVVGSEDGVLPGAMEEMASGFGSGAEYALIDGVGHFPVVEKAEEFARIMTGFLEEV